jgi:hypothetical protein
MAASALALFALLALAPSVASAEALDTAVEAPSAVADVTTSETDSPEPDSSERTFAAVEGPSFEERAILGAITGVSAASATLAGAAAIFSATIAFAAAAPLLVQLLLLPLFPFTLFVPPLVAVVTAVLAAWPTTDWFGLCVIGAVTGTAALVSFLAATIITAPILLGAFADDRFAPGRGVFEGAILANVLLPPLVVGIAAGAASAFVVDGPPARPSSE